MLSECVALKYNHSLIELNKELMPSVKHETVTYRLSRADVSMLL